eukprot:1180931-Prorocentrum_minimum.AAC.5
MEGLCKQQTSVKGFWFPYHDTSCDTTRPLMTFSVNFSVKSCRGSRGGQKGVKKGSRGGQERAFGAVVFGSSRSSHSTQGAWGIRQGECLFCSTRGCITNQDWRPKHRTWYTANALHEIAVSAHRQMTEPYHVKLACGSVRFEVVLDDDEVLAFELDFVNVLRKHPQQRWGKTQLSLHARELTTSCRNTNRGDHVERGSYLVFNVVAVDA